MKQKCGRPSFLAATKIGMAAALVVAANTSWAAADAPVFGLTVDFSSNACANYGDFISCSAQYLNLITTGSVTGNATTDYVLQAPQGFLASTLNIIVGGGQEDNSEFTGTPGGIGVDDAYGPFGAGSVTEYGTFNANSNAGGVDPTTAVAGEVTGTAGNLTAWDIGLVDLVAALTTPDGVRHQLLIFFDNNQAGSDPAQLIKANTLVCANDNAGVLAPVCFELIDENGTGSNTDITDPANGDNIDPSLFVTSKTYGQFETSSSNLLVRANGSFCVDASNTVVQLNNAACPAGSVLVNNNLGTNDVEFILNIPELDAGLNSLENLIAAGYDRFTWQQYFYSNTNGFEDIFLLAGAPITTTQVPEPATLALLGLSLVGFGIARRRKA